MPNFRTILEYNLALLWCLRRYNKIPVGIGAIFMVLFFVVIQLYGSGDEVNILANKINNEFSLAIKSYFSRVIFCLFCLVLFFICIHFCYITDSSSTFLFLTLINIYEFLSKAQNSIASTKKKSNLQPKSTENPLIVLFLWKISFI